MKCLDTDLLIAILRGEDEAKKVGLELDVQGRAATTSVNAFEIFYGAFRSKNRLDNLQRARMLLQRLDLIPFSFQASEKAGELLADLATVGKYIEYRDAMIAGTVLESGMTLVTRNRKHFERIPKLKLEIW